MSMSDISYICNKLHLQQDKALRCLALSEIKNKVYKQRYVVMFPFPLCSAETSSLLLKSPPLYGIQYQFSLLQMSSRQVPPLIVYQREITHIHCEGETTKEAPHYRVTSFVSENHSDPNTERHAFHGNSTNWNNCVHSGDESHQLSSS